MGATRGANIVDFDGGKYIEPATVLTPSKNHAMMSEFPTLRDATYSLIGPLHGSNETKVTPSMAMLWPHARASTIDRRSDPFSVISDSAKITIRKNFNDAS
ncbi:hypothetical protein ACMAZE_04280 [Pseudopelagicola sp. nBUS_20]|uniref:hypothetical protein n=1 Tax=Pseudopelagicola sp. nBUS_20 TaxID=3395317 RepID=UPI003EBFDEBB